MSESFQNVIQALFHEQEEACSFAYSTAQDAVGVAIPLRSVQDARTLPPYWTLAYPEWFDPTMGFVAFEDWRSSTGELHTRRLHQEVDWFENGQMSGMQPRSVYAKHSPFLIFEIDYLIFDKMDVGDDSKKLQLEALEFAFRQSGFPFTALVSSGSKSIHVYIRLADDIDTIVRFYNSVWYTRLQEMAWMVLGSYDHSVFTQGGRGARLVRMPGALRENGAEQTILAVGEKIPVGRLLQWFFDQLGPDAQREINGRDPLPKELDADKRRFRLRIPKWRADLLKPHLPGSRGGDWHFVSKSLAMAGLRAPVCQARPTAAQPWGQWSAPWLWWLSAFVFNKYSNGWFFSQDPKDWKDEHERVRWYDSSALAAALHEQVQYEQRQQAQSGTTLDARRLLEQMHDTTARLEALGLPPVTQAPGVNPAPFIGGVVGTPQPPQVQPEREKRPKREKTDHLAFMEHFFRTCIAREHLACTGTLSGEQWFHFNGKIWEVLDPSYIKAIIACKLMVGYTDNHRNEVFKHIQCHVYHEKPWLPSQTAIAFQNGTMYLDRGQWVDGHVAVDHLMTMVPCAYDPAARCPLWEQCLARFLPDDGRRLLLQEMFGYTFMAGQPLQAFFLLLGSGANFKGTTLRVLEALHKGAHEAVSLAMLSGRFSLGTAWNKRIAVDGDADSLGGRKDSAELMQIVSKIKAWTGGDGVQIEKKTVQGWTVFMQPKLILAANRRPRFVDPTHGIWRRLKIIKYEVTISEEEKIPDFHQRLIRDELQGIVNWALLGLQRLLATRRFTESAAIKADLEEYQVDMDSVFQFKRDCLMPAAQSGWWDLRSFFETYKEYCYKEINAHPVSLQEFKQRLEVVGVLITKPPDDAPIYGAPLGLTKDSPRPLCVSGWKCHHPHFSTLQVQTLYPNGTVVPRGAAPAIVGGPPIPFPGPGKKEK